MKIRKKLRQRRAEKRNVNSEAPKKTDSDVRFHHGVTTRQISIPTNEVIYR